MNYRIYVDLVERTPKNVGSLSLNFEKFEDNGALFFRKTLSDSLKFSGVDYEFFNGISDICQQIDIRIDQICDTGTQTIFEGITAITKCSFSHDTCNVEVEVDVNDDYSCILDNADKEVNILQEPNIVTVKVSDLQSFEYLLQNDPQTDPQWDSVDSYTTVNFETFLVTARKVVATACVGGVPQTPADDGSGEAWNLLSNDCATDGVAKWYRFLNPAEEALIVLALHYEECLIPNCPSPNPAPANSFLIGSITGATSGITAYILNNVVTDQDIPNGRYLTNVIDYMLSQNGCALTLSSDFFNNATNPVTGNPSTTQNLVLFEKSDVVRPTATEKATKSLVTINQLMNDLNVLFNVRWNVSGVNLVIEHISDLTQAVGLDLTLLNSGIHIEGKNAFDYLDAEIPLEEKYKFPIEALNVDFAGLPIEYNTQCSTVPETIYQTQRIETELDRIYQNDDEGLDGVVLVSPETVNKAGANSSLAENGRITNVFQPNAPMGYAALLPDYHTWDRPLPSGDINGVNTVMDSTQPLKKQVELKVPFCCINDFNPIELVRTQIGDGEVLEASYQLKTKTLVLSLGFQL